MQVTRILTGPIPENCYIVSDKKHCLIIDPGAEGAKIQQIIASTNTTPIAILLTHTHYDHIGAVDELRERYQVPLYVSPLEASWLQDPLMNLSGLPRHDDIADIYVKTPAELFNYQTYTLNEFTFAVVPTPGHSIGSVSFVFDDFVISGDALFKGSIGRTDLPTGNLEQLLQSIRSQLFILPDTTTVYPGHGDATTILAEKQTNPFFHPFKN
ncbi:MAG: MBL fold metallo-hydrolase [Enterococcus sp.]